MQHNDLIKHMSRRIEKYSKFLLAFSGGLDSTVLLHILAQLRTLRPDIVLRAIYVHHGLSENADIWLEHCKKICSLSDIIFLATKVNLDIQEKGVEAAARQARYQAFSDALLPNEVLLTAQHLNDQCETFFLALKRGSGPAGLASMAESSPFAQGTLLRPLINIKRSDLLEYAKSWQLSWVEDESNEDTRYDRNFLRKKILPLLTERWPNFSEVVSRSANLCAQQEQLIDELLSEQLVKLVDEKHSIDISALEKMSDVCRQALLRRWLGLSGQLMPSRQQLNHLWLDIAMSRCDAEPSLKLDQCEVRRFNNKLFLLPLMVSQRDTVIDWDGINTLELPDSLGSLVSYSLTEHRIGDTTSTLVRKTKQNEKITIRFYSPGKISIVGRNGSRMLKKLWQEFYIPPWQRGRIPLLYYNETLIAAIGVFITLDGQVTDRLSVCEIMWQKGTRAI